MLIIGALHGAASGRRLAAVVLADRRDASTPPLRHLLGGLSGRPGFPGRAVVRVLGPRLRHQEIVAGAARYGLLTIRATKPCGGAREPGEIDATPRGDPSGASNRTPDARLRLGAPDPRWTGCGGVPRGAGAVHDSRVLARVPDDGPMTVSIVMPVFNGAARVGRRSPRSSVSARSSSSSSSTMTGPPTRPPTCFRSWPQRIRASS